jgi:hypothetical protein
MRKPGRLMFDNYVVLVLGSEMNVASLGSEFFFCHGVVHYVSVDWVLVAT